MYQHETSLIRVVQIGLGPIGLSATRYLCEQPRLRIVGAIDIDPDKQGKDLGELAGMTSLGLSVCGALDQHGADCLKIGRWPCTTPPEPRAPGRG